MKDQRVSFFRGLVNALVESLDATVRITRWSGAEGVPEPLKVSASQLLDRLGAANRLASGKFQGSPVVVACMTAMSGAVQKLDTAYVQYRKRLDSSPGAKDEAAIALEAELGEVKADAHRWA
jgi:hypothetical protein